MLLNREGQQMSLYFAHGNVSTAFQQIEAELQYLGNIKSRKKRLQALRLHTNMLKVLKQYKAFPDNGLVIFSGESSEEEPITSITTWFEPFEPLEKSEMRTSQNFFLQVGIRTLSVTNINQFAILTTRTNVTNRS